MLKNSKIDIFVSGNFSEGNSDVDEIIKKQINEKNVQPRNIDVYVENEVKEPVAEKVVRETMDVSQGKLVIGLDVTKLEPEDKAVASVYNAILGGGANSKLFQNVREKAHLAYVASSSYLRHKNNIFINCGIEIANYEKALELIKEELNIDTIVNNYEYYNSSIESFTIQNTKHFPHIEEPKKFIKILTDFIH